jgi:hypothetical protein
MFTAAVAGEVSCLPQAVSLSYPHGTAPNDVCIVEGET